MGNSNHSVGDLLLRKSINPSREALNGFVADEPDFSEPIQISGQLVFPESSSDNACENTAASSSTSSSLSKSNQFSLGRCLSDHIKVKLAHDCAAGVAFVHSKGLMHCDIKSLNFLVTSNLRVKLADLGEARSVSDMRMSETKMLPR